MELTIARDKEDWNNKGKFPPSIKPLLAQIALQAVELDEYDEHFFNLMATLFPYNKFTITVSLHALCLLLQVLWF